MGEITELLSAANGGDRGAAHRLFGLMYQELRALAHSSLRKAGGSSELDTTVLVHESFLKLQASAACTPADRAAFYVYVGKVMRSVVLDVVRERMAHKRGAGLEFVALTTGVAQEKLDESQLIALDDALTSLGTLAPALKELVEMRYFAGLSVPEISELLHRPVRSIERDWVKARLLLRRLLQED
jgi:RNA polymerase sigma factor (TIGR02999 family)